MARCSFTEPGPKWVPPDGEQPCGLAQDRRVPRTWADLHETVPYSPEASGAHPAAGSAPGVGVQVQDPDPRGGVVVGGGG